MRVLHVTPSHARRDGGPSETLRGLIPALKSLGIDVRLLSTDKGAVEDDNDIFALCPAFVVRSRPPRSWNFAPGMVPILWREVRSADVVHIHSVNSFTTSAAMTICAIRGTPFILEPHGALDSYHIAQNSRRKLLYNSLVDGWNFRRAAAVIASSRRELADARRHLQARGVLMPLGVEEELLSVERASDGRTVLFLGRLALKKRLDLVLRALADPELGANHVRLIVAGPMGSDLDFDPAELARSLGISERVEFVGRADATLRRSLLSKSDVFVLPSEDESFGVSVAEAMAAGCAVVASSNVGLAPDAAAAGALVLCELEAESLARSIEEAFLSRDRIAKAARLYASTNFRWSVSASILRSTYSEAKSR